VRQLPNKESLHCKEQDQKLREYKPEGVTVTTDERVSGKEVVGASE
jgi:hypothetical protein